MKRYLPFLFVVFALLACALLVADEEPDCPPLARCEGIGTGNAPASDGVGGQVDAYMDALGEAHVHASDQCGQLCYCEVTTMSEAYGPYQFEGNDGILYVGYTIHVWGEKCLPNE